MTQRLAYPLNEAAELIGVSVRSLRYLLQQGRVGYVRLGRRVLVKREDLERLLRQHYCRPGTPVDTDTPIRPSSKPENSDARESANSRASNRDVPLGRGDMVYGIRAHDSTQSTKQRTTDQPYSVTASSTQRDPC